MTNTTNKRIPATPAALAKTASALNLKVNLEPLFEEEAAKDEERKKAKRQKLEAKMAKDGDFVGPPRPTVSTYRGGKKKGTSFFDEKGREYVVDNENQRRYLITNPSTIQDAKNNLLFLRLRKGFTQAGFARVLGISQTLASAWEKPDIATFCSYAYAVRIAEILDTDPHYIDRSGLRFLVPDGSPRPRGSSASCVVSLYRKPTCLRELKQNLCYHRLRNGMTLDQVADALEIDRSELESWEDMRSDAFFPDKMVFRVAAALNCPVEDLNEYGFNGAPTRGSISPVMAPAKLQRNPATLAALKENLRYYREKLGLSLRDAARKIGVGTSAYCDWEDLACSDFIAPKYLDKAIIALLADRSCLVLDEEAAGANMRALVQAEPSVPTLMPVTDAPLLSDIEGAEEAKAPMLSTQLQSGANWADELIGINRSPFSAAPSCLDPTRPNAIKLARLEPISRAGNLEEMAAAKSQTNIFELTGLAANSARYASAVVQGDSMQNASGSGLCSEDVVIIDLVQRDLSTLVGSLVCVSFSDGTLWVRRLKQENGGFYLGCDNPVYKSYKLSIGNSAHLIGKVVSSMRKL